MQPTIITSVPDSPQPKPDEKNIVLKAIHDETGWRVQFLLMVNGKCVGTVEGHARFADEASCHGHGRWLNQVLDNVLGLEKLCEHQMNPPEESLN